MWEGRTITLPSDAPLRSISTVSASAYLQSAIICPLIRGGRSSVGCQEGPNNATSDLVPVGDGVCGCCSGADNGSARHNDGGYGLRNERHDRLRRATGAGRG